MDGKGHRAIAIVWGDPNAQKAEGRLGVFYKVHCLVPTEDELSPGVGSAWYDPPVCIMQWLLV